MLSKLQTLIFANLLYMIPATYFFLQRSDMEFLAYEGIVILIGLLFIYLLKKDMIKYHEVWLFSIWGFFHLMGGLLIFDNGRVLYQQILFDIIDNGGGYVLLKMDQVIHFYGFGLVAFMMYRVLNERIQNVSTVFLIVFSTMIAIGFGALNEVIEFTIVLLVEFNGVGDLYNMGLDLMFNLAGALTGAIIQHLRLK